MAETAQFYLESMVPELRELEERGIFSPLEIKSIIKKRTEFEYSLKKRRSIKSDYLRYIEYELNLEALRKRRKEKLNITSKKSISDFSGVKHILHIFDRACRKFHGDLNLWIEYARIANKLGSGKVAGRSLARAVQYHPTNPLSWLSAAKWEWEENGNVSSARILLQRGLRINSDSLDLWIQYFKLECYFIIKLMERHKVLGIGLNEELEKASKSEKSIAVDDLPNPESLEEDNMMDKHRNDGFDSFFNGAVPIAVCKYAYFKNPDNEELSLKLLHCLSQIQSSYPSLDKCWNNIKDFMTQNLKDNYCNSARAINAVFESSLANVNLDSAEFPVILKNQLIEFVEIWRSIVSQGSTAEIIKFAEAHLSLILKLNDRLNGAKVRDKVKQFVEEYMEKFCAECIQDLAIPSESIGVAWLELLARNKKLEFRHIETMIQLELDGELLNTKILKLVKKLFPDQFENIFAEIKSKATMKSQIKLSLFYLENMAKDRAKSLAEYKQCVQLVDTSNLDKSDLAFSIFKSYFKFLKANVTQNEYRKTVLLYAQNKRRDPRFFANLIEMENSSERDMDINWLRQLYERCMLCNPGDVQGWLDLAIFELKKAKNFEMGVKLFHRAMNCTDLAADDRDKFSQEYSRLMSD